MRENRVVIEEDEYDEIFRLLEDLDEQFLESTHNNQILFPYSLHTVEIRNRLTQVMDLDDLDEITGLLTEIESAVPGEGFSN